MSSLVPAYGPIYNTGAPTGLPANYVLLFSDNSGASNATIYLGYGMPGTSASAAGVAIKNIQYDANGNPNYLPWGNVSNNTPATNLIWNSRASYTYS